jgi:hypothetical protein
LSQTSNNNELVTLPAQLSGNHKPRKNTQYAISDLQQNDNYFYGLGSHVDSAILDSILHVQQIVPGVTNSITVSIDADYDYYLRHQDTWEQDLGTTFDVTRSIYRENFGWNLVPVGFHIWTTSANNPLVAEGVNQLLFQFRSAASSGGYLPTAHIYHLVTGKDVYGPDEPGTSSDIQYGYVGNAFLGTTCVDPSSSYSISENFNDLVDPTTLAHEIGHNLNALHDVEPDFVMSQEISSVFQVKTFSGQSRNSIRGHINLYQSRCGVNLTLSPVATATPTPTRTPTRTATATFTSTPTRTPTATFTSTPTFTPTRVATGLPTLPPTATATPTFTPTPSPTPTPTITSTPTAAPSPTPTRFVLGIQPTATSTPQNVASGTPSSVVTIAPTATVTRVIATPDPSQPSPTPRTIVDFDFIDIDPISVDLPVIKIEPLVAEISKKISLIQSRVGKLVRDFEILLSRNQFFVALTNGRIELVNSVVNKDPANLVSVIMNSGLNRSQVNLISFSPGEIKDSSNTVVGYVGTLTFNQEKTLVEVPAGFENALLFLQEANKESSIVAKRTSPKFFEAQAQAEAQRNPVQYILIKSGKHVINSNYFIEASDVDLNVTPYSLKFDRRISTRGFVLVEPHSRLSDITLGKIKKWSVQAKDEVTGTSSFMVLRELSKERLTRRQRRIVVQKLTE